MNPPAGKRSRKNEWVLWVGLLLLVATICLAFMLAHLRMRAFLGKPLPVYGPIGGFVLTNQNASAFALGDLKGHVWVADVFFTRCAGPCLKMSRQMKELQDTLPPASGAKLVSVTTDPLYDTPTVLKNYAERFGADPNRWLFLTGSKQQVTNLIGSLKLAAVEKKPGEAASTSDLFIHSTIFVVIDKQSQLRGIFETMGEGVDPDQAKMLLRAAVRRLEREP